MKILVLTDEQALAAGKFLRERLRQDPLGTIYKEAYNQQKRQAQEVLALLEAPGKNNTQISLQLQRDIDRARQLNADDPAMDWDAYSLSKDALLAVASLLPPEIALQVMNLVGTIDNVDARKVLGK